MATYSGPDDLSGTEFIETNFADSVFREVDLSGVRIRGALLNGADLDGVIDGLRVNGVEVAPLVEAELDRLHPERTRLRPSTPDGMRIAWETVEAFWAPTMARAGSMPEQDVHRSVDGEWSFVQTLRHLVFAMDKWFTAPILGEGFHPIGLPNSGSVDFPWPDLVYDLQPSVSEALAVRADRATRFRDYLTTVGTTDLTRPVDVLENGTNPIQECLYTVFEEEFWHDRYARRDLEQLAVA